MNAKTREILDIFAAINRIPRCSGREGPVAAWLRDWAVGRGFSAAADDAGNLVITVPASEGYENAPVVVIQGHMDMVCEKTPDAIHDFSRDPIRMRCEGDWVTADGTTLGADNGIALALALALAADPSVAHPPLELLFTVDEETGLTGAKKLRPGFFKGRILLNVDSEIEGVFTVGCAGGEETRIRLPLRPSPVGEGEIPVRIGVRGLRGGHSGIDIVRQRANANVVLARCLAGIAKAVPLRVVTLKGGTVHNAIPRDAEAVIAVEEPRLEGVRRAVAAFARTVAAEYAPVEPSLGIDAEALPPADSRDRTAMSAAESEKAVRLILALPHGVDRFSPEAERLVETSSNLATVATAEGRLEILTSQRSSNPSALEALSARIAAVAHLAGAAVETENGYPAWTPDMDSPLLARCREVYRTVFGGDPAVEVIHAGLECAIIGAAFEGVDMISFGPDLENPHSPDERLNIPSVGRVWDFTTALLASYKP